MAKIVYTDDPIVVNKYGSKYSIRYTFICDGKTTTKTVANNQTANTYSFTPSSAEFGPLMIKSIRGVLTIDVLPNDNSTQGFQTYTYTLCMNESIAPGLDGNISTVLSNDLNGKVIAGVTYVSIRMNVKNVYSATQKIEIQKDGVTINTYSLDGVNDAKTQQLTISLGKMYDTPSKLSFVFTDSRGRTRTYNQPNPFTVYPYERPIAKVSIEWNDNDKPVLTFTEKHQETVADEVNSIQRFDSYTTVNDAGYTKSLLNETSPLTIDSQLFDTSKQYVFKITIVDLCTTEVSYVTLDRQFIPMIDFSADGNTIAIFGAAPQASTEKKLIIGDTSNLHCEYINDTFSVLADASNPVATFEKSETNKPIITFGTRTAGTGSVKGNYSVVNGNRGNAAGDYSYAGGYYPIAKGSTSFVHGHQAETRKNYSQAFGYNTVNNNLYGMVIGRFNNYSATNALFIIGDGDSFSNRKNVFEVFRGGEATLNGKSVNSMFGGLVGHWYGGSEMQRTVDSGNNNNAYYPLPFFNGGATGPYSKFITIDSTYKDSFSVNRTGIYSIQARIAIKSTVANKRVEIAPYVNESRVARQCSTYCTPAVFYINTLINYTFQLNKDDTFSLQISPVDAVSVECQAMDILITVLDYEGKYK